MSPPKVSIGIPVFNGEQYIGQALDALLAQSWRDFEIIISDNASTDRTEAICREYVARDARVVYHRPPENLGAINNFNRLVALSRGEYFSGQPPTTSACRDISNRWFKFWMNSPK